MESFNDLLSDREEKRESAWRALYKKNFHVIQNFVRKHGGTTQEASDVFHDGLVILKSSLKKGAFRQESSIHTYLFSICRNLWYKYYFKKNNRIPFAPEGELITEEDEEYLKKIALLPELLDRLSEDCKKILTEFYFKNRKMEELRIMFNLGSVQAAKTKKYRCLNCLADLFKSIKTKGE